MQWLRNGTNIASATASSYTVAAEDVGASVACRVAASNREGRAEATSDSEEYQRALYHYTQLVRHRMANPLHIIGGAAATLQAQPELDSLARNALLAEIYKQTKVLERVCLEPKVMHPSENGLEPMPASRRPPG